MGELSGEEPFTQREEIIRNMILFPIGRKGRSERARPAVYGPSLILPGDRLHQSSVLATLSTHFTMFSY